MAGNPNYIEMPVDGAGKKVQTWDNTIGGNDVHTEAITITDSTGTEKATSGNPLRVDPTGTTVQPVSGTVTANQGTAAAAAGSWPVEVTDGTNVLGTSSHPLRVDPTGTTTQPVVIAGISVGIDVQGTSTVAVTGQIAGPVAAGTAASSSVLTGGVYNTSAPAPTNGQQLATQLDSAGNLRINPYGNIGSFASVLASVTSSISGTLSVAATLTVPAATKWNVRSVVLDDIGSGNQISTRQLLVTVADASGNVIAETPSSSATSITSTVILRAVASVGLSQNTAPVTLGPTTATQVVFLSLAKVLLGPSFTIKGTVYAGGDTGTHTLTLKANVHAISD